MVAGGKYLGKVFLHAVPVVQMADRQRGKADDGIHRGADVVGHIGKEGALGAVGVFGGGHGIRERLVRLPVGGAVRQNQNVLGFALDLAAHGNHMEPAMLPGFLMDKLRVPFALVAAGKPFQIIFGAAGGIRRVQQGQRADILAHALQRQAQQPFYVRADIIRPVLLGIQQQENVVHVLGQLLEQHIPVQNRGVLAAQLGAAPVHDHQKDHCRNRQDNEGYDLHRALPKPVHGGIDGIPRDKPHQGPVLDAGAFVDHIVSCAVQRHLAVSGDALRKVVRKLLYLRLGKVGILAQYRHKIVNGFRAFCDIFDQDLPVRVDDKGAGRSAERRIVHGLHHNIVVVADGNGIVGKAAVDALGFGADEHQHRVLSGQGRVQHNVLLVGKQLVEVGLQA